MSDKKPSFADSVAQRGLRITINANNSDWTRPRDAIKLIMAATECSANAAKTIIRRRGTRHRMRACCGGFSVFPAGLLDELKEMQTGYPARPVPARFWDCKELSDHDDPFWSTGEADIVFDGHRVAISDIRLMPDDVEAAVKGHEALVTIPPTVSQPDPTTRDPLQPGRRRGRPPGSGSLAPDDAPLWDEMAELIASRKSLSPNAAAIAVAARAAGAGTFDTKVTRLRNGYLERERNRG